MPQKNKFNLLKTLIRGLVALIVVFSLATPMSVSAFISIRNGYPIGPREDGLEIPMAEYFMPPLLMPAIYDSNDWDSDMLSERSPTRRREGLDIRGLIPEIDEEFNAAETINHHISEYVVEALISEARRLRARTITFGYEYHPTNDVISIVIYANVVTTLPHTLVRSVNFSASDGTLLSMDDATGMNVTPLAGRILAEKIRSNPERYYAALSIPLASQAFFVTDDRLVILFDGFRLSTRVGDVETLELIFQNINTVILTTEDYRPNGPYGLKMIPLRAMLEGQLGYNIRWCDEYNYAAVYRNSTRIIKLRPNDNEYIVLDTQRRSLESAPLIFNGSMYVPITFFDQILPLTTYTVDSEGNITFLAYLT
ncbi:MAG: stalk domain-containing protein [Defluviitaleaceae bacterium]|nr:stalk domain-containing protein [Defluviitaleaceae bacterium]